MHLGIIDTVCIIDVLESPAEISELPSRQHRFPLPIPAWNVASATEPVRYQKLCESEI
jgi:hypothetical protein